ncbi:MAG: calcium/sodium antiporter [Candidatus Marinimicrobia bacterium]|nr:calcium/sodium antiporter [Candidatus Neomarinimicrobiota bacterium]MCH7763660.1 calcium/sodium antiporter [Candidatus Neomarinimicrobiota bacterium]
MITSIGFLILGSLLLYYGANWIVQGGSRLASQIGLSPLVIGLTVVAFGTSLPEMVVSLAAAAKDSSTIAIGNVIGSNIANVGLVLGLSALLFPITITFSRIRYDLFIYLLAALLFTYFCSDGLIDRWEGAVMFAGIIIYTGYCIIHPHRRVAKNKDGKYSISKCVLYLLIGAVLLYFGSNLFVEGAIFLAKFFGVSEIVIGMSIVALGTSLPELATSIVAAFHKESGISVGNIIGSNLFNILSVIGLVSFLHPLDSPQEIMFLEIPFMIAFGVVLFPIALMKQPIPKFSAGVLLAGYILFIFLLFN